MDRKILAGVYSNHIFSTENPTKDQQDAQKAAADDLVQSGMDVVVLASFHVHADGSIFFNDTSAVSGGKATGLLNPDLADLLAHMQKAGITILASFGGGGSFHGKAVGELDFDAIKHLDAEHPDPAKNPFYQNLAELFRIYPAISGLDNDLESYNGYTQYQATVNKLTHWLTTNGYVATIAPFNAPSFWKTVLEDSTHGKDHEHGTDDKQGKDSSGDPAISWVNLQNASGTLAEFVSAFGGVWSDVPAHLLAGEQIGQGTSAQEVELTFSAIRQHQPGLRGGWLWTYEQFTGGAAAYAAAIKSGLALHALESPPR